MKGQKFAKVAVNAEAYVLLAKWILWSWHGYSKHASTRV